MRLKMTQKMIIFQFIFHLIFGFHFQAPLQKCFYCQQVQCDLSTCLLCHQRQGSKPQSLSVPKWAQKPSLKVIESATINSSDKEDLNSQLQSTKVCCISWTVARTEKLLDWLGENPVDQHKFFSDSTKNAMDEGWRKYVAKGMKSEFHRLMAVFVFSVDAHKDVQDDFVVNGGNYMKSVDNYLGW